MAPGPGPGPDLDPVIPVDPWVCPGGKFQEVLNRIG